MLLFYVANIRLDVATCLIMSLIFFHLFLSSPLSRIILPSTQRITFHISFIIGLLVAKYNWIFTEFRSGQKKLTHLPSSFSPALLEI